MLMAILRKKAEWADTDIYNHDMFTSNRTLATFPGSANANGGTRKRTPRPGYNVMLDNMLVTQREARR